MDQKGTALSVVIATWNRRSFVTQAIDSVIGQQYEGPLEIVVVDDGSTDGTLREVSARYSVQGLPSNRRLIIHSKPHTGISGTMGKGIELSSGDYVAMCHSDDLWEPVRAAELLAEVDKTPRALIHTNCKFRVMDGVQLRDRRDTDDHVGLVDRIPVEYPGNVTLQELLLGQLGSRLYFGGGLTIFPRKFLQAEFAMPQGLWHEETWFLFAAMMQGAIRFANCNSYVFRIHGRNDSLLETNASRERVPCDLVLLERAITILRKHPNTDATLLRRLETRERIDKYRLDVNGGSSCWEALRGMPLSDFLSEPRMVLSATLGAKAPSLHGFLRRAKLGLSGKRSSGRSGHRGRSVGDGSTGGQTKTTGRNSRRGETRS